MTGLNVPTLKTLGAENIEQLAGAAGPCVTIVLPPYRPGAQTKSMAAILRTYCQEIERQLSNRRIEASEITNLIEPLLQVTASPEFSAGSHWSCALFRSPETFAKLDGIEALNPSLSVGGCFQIRMVLPELHLPSAFYLLKLTQKDVELWHCTRLRAESVMLPKGVPQTLDEALAFKPPDHDLENRSAAGHSAGALRGIRFGTGSERENASAYLADFYKAVDRGVRELTRGSGIPLVLAGVEEDTFLYRAVSNYPALLKESIHGSGGVAFSQDELRQANAIVRTDATERAAASLLELKERTAPARISTDLPAILSAAVEGRVGRLYINQEAQVPGVFDRVRRAGRVNWGQEDLLNVAAVETILDRGLVFALPADAMPERVAAIAVFRY